MFFPLKRYINFQVNKRAYVQFHAANAIPSIEVTIVYTTLVSLN